MPTFLDDGPGLRDVLQGLLREKDEDAAAAVETGYLSMMEWSNRAPEPKFGLLRMDLFPYQAPHPVSSLGPGEPGLYSDEVANAREVVVMKATQVGLTSNMWRWAIRRADLFSDTVIYVFPTDTHVTQFGQERIDPSLEESEYLQTRIGKVNNSHQKQIGGGWVYFRGSTQQRVGKRGAGQQSVGAQSIVFDEYDDLDERGVAQYERRTSGAQGAGLEPRWRRIGVPTMEEYGIAGRYAKSDQRVWMVACPACRLEQEVTWDENMRWRNEGSSEVLSPGDDTPGEVEEAWRVCRECEAPLDVGDGRWVARNPGARVVGFHVTRLIVPNTDLTQMVRDSRLTAAHEIESHYNNDLGLPYTPDEAGLTRDVVEAAISMGLETASNYTGPYLVTAGMDVASARRMHIRITVHLPGGIRHPLRVSEVEDFAEAHRLMQDYRIRLLAVDALPERQKARELAAAFPGRVVLTRYDERDEADPVKINDNKNLVDVHRTEAINSMIAQIRDGSRPLPHHAPRGYVDHLIALKRRRFERAKGSDVYRYVTVGGRGDDFAHAEVFDLVAEEVLRKVIDEQGMGGFSPATPESLGYQPVSLGGEPEDD